MKKLLFGIVLFFVAFVFGSCAIGSYVPSSLNIGGVSTQVVLSQANYRVVRNIETVVDINNSHLRRADVEKSAFAELTRMYPLTGSQAYINVVLEEVRRESTFSLKQHVAIRATIIEFLQENGEPIKSVNSEYNTYPQRLEQKNEESAHDREQKELTQEQLVLKQLTEKEVNKYYIAYLYKSKKLNGDRSVLDIFNWTEISSIAQRNDIKDLIRKSKGHDPEFERFADQSVQREEVQKDVEVLKNTNENLAELALLPQNQYYIMLLFKTGDLKPTMLSELKKYFDVKNMNYNAYTIKFLRENSAEHDKVFEKFAN